MSVIAEHPRVSTKAKISTITSWKFTLNIQLWKVQLLKYTQCGKICVYTDMAELNFGYGMYLTVKIIGTDGGLIKNCSMSIVKLKVENILVAICIFAVNIALEKDDL